MTRTGQFGFVLDTWVELTRRIPEDTQWALPARVVPHTCGHSPTGPRDSQHLTQPWRRVSHEVHYELGQRSIESPTAKRQLLGGRTLDPYSGIALREAEAHEGSLRTQRGHS